MSNQLSKLYRDSMRKHSFGYALYEPCLFDDLHPGMIGFLDDYGRWHAILNADDHVAIMAAGYSEMESQICKQPEAVTWGPLASTDVSEYNADLSLQGGAAALGLPVDIGGAVRYKSASDFGAILMCDSGVFVEGYDLRSPFKNWLKANSKKLLENSGQLEKVGDLSEFGVIAVTWTYSSNDVFIKTWNKRSHEEVLGFKASSAGVANLEGNMSWMRSNASSGWRRYSGSKRVTFFTGVKINYWRIMGATFTISQEESGWRGGEDDFEIELDDDTRFRVEMEDIGIDWDQLKEDDDDDDN